jgi:hypothetical protein
MHWLRYPLALIIALLGLLKRKEPDPDDETIEPHPTDKDKDR